MAYAYVQIKVNEAGAPTPPPSDQVPNCIGVCSLGVTGQGYSFGSIAGMKESLGHGHLVDVLQVFKEAGLATLLATPADDTSIAGTTSAVTQTGTGDPMVVAGTPLHDLEIIVEVMAAGTTANGLAKVRWAVDAYPDTEPTWTSPVTVTADPIVLADTAMSIDWPDVSGNPAALVLGTKFRCSTRPAHYNSGAAPTQVQLQSLITRAASFLLYTGAGATASAADTFAVAMGTLVNNLASSSARFVFALGPASLDTPSNVATAFADTVVAPLPFVMVGYGDGVIALSNAIPGRGFVRLQEHEVVAYTLLKRTVSGAPSRTRAGALPLRSIGFDGSIAGSTVHDSKVSTLVSEGIEGFFVGGQPLLHAPGSKINQVQHASVLCRAMQVAYAVLFKWKSEGARANLDSTLDPRDVNLITQELFDAEKVAIVDATNDRGITGHVSSMRVEVSTTAVLPRIEATIYIKPLGYPTELIGTITVL